MSESLQKLVEMLQKASPVVWQAAYRQARIEAIECIVGAIILVTTSIVLFRLFQKAKVTGPYDDGELKKGALFIGSLAAMLFTVLCVSTAIEYLLNPNYAAIKELKGLL